MATHKILYSPGFGAGWSTWAYTVSAEQRRFLLTYQPLIDALEAGEDIGYDDKRGGAANNFSYTRPGSVLDRFRQDWIATFGDDDDLPYMGGARDLAVAVVDGPFRIDEYDGNESIILASQQSWIDLDKEV